MENETLRELVWFTQLKEIGEKRDMRCEKIKFKNKSETNNNLLNTGFLWFAENSMQRKLFVFDVIFLFHVNETLVHVRFGIEMMQIS